MYIALLLLLCLLCLLVVFVLLSPRSRIATTRTNRRGPVNAGYLQTRPRQTWLHRIGRNGSCPTLGFLVPCRAKTVGSAFDAFAQNLTQSKRHVRKRHIRRHPRTEYAWGLGGPAGRTAERACKIFRIATSTLK